MKKIMFSDQYNLTKAVIDGWKTMTRRMFTVTFLERSDDGEFHEVEPERIFLERGKCIATCNGRRFIVPKENLPKYNLGDIVAVAQSYKDAGYDADAEVTTSNSFVPVKAISTVGWNNKMFTAADMMPHQIKITGTRIERLQDISDEDCLREGVRYFPDIDLYFPDICLYYFERVDKKQGFYFNSPREAFASLIDKVSGAGTWDSNPFVVVYEFELVK